VVARANGQQNQTSRSSVLDRVLNQIDQPALHQVRIGQYPGHIAGNVALDLDFCLV
jgi:hypothetical protein